MVVKKSFLTWILSICWVAIFFGLLLTSTVNADSEESQSGEKKTEIQVEAEKVSDGSEEEEEPSVSVHKEQIPGTSKEKEVITIDEKETNINKPESAGPGMLKTKLNSVEECAKACNLEQSIKCKFFKFQKESGTCLMSANLQQNMHPSDDNIDMEINIHNGNRGKSKKGMTRWIEDVNSRLNELEAQDREIENLKSSITEINEELRMMKRTSKNGEKRTKETMETQQEAYKRLGHNLAGIRIEEEKVKTAVHALSNMQRVLAKEVGDLKTDQQTVQSRLAELGTAGGEVNSLIAALKATDSTLQRDLDSVKEGATNLAAAFAKHRKSVNEALNSRKMPPAMVKMKHNQGTLATALESVMDKVSSLMGRLPYLEDEVKSTSKNLQTQSEYQHEMKGKLVTFYKNLIEIKKAVHTLLDPRSAVNMDRNKRLMMLTADVSTLSQRDKDTRASVQEQRKDLAKLVKDVTNIQLMSQQLGDQLTKVQASSRQLRQEINDVKTKMKEPKAELKMAEIQKQVMTNLDRLKTREAILLKQLNLYRASVKKLDGQVEKSSISRSKTEDAVKELQNRLLRFEKQIQLLFDKTTALTHQITSKPKGQEEKVKKLELSQSSTEIKLTDIAQELATIRKRVSLLAIELENTKKEEQAAKEQLARDVQERKEEMELREKELKEQAKIQHAEEARIMQMKEKALEKQRKQDEERMEKELAMERDKLLRERQEKKKALDTERKKRKKEQEAYRKKLESQKKDLEKKMKERKKKKEKSSGKTGKKTGKKKGKKIKITKKPGKKGKKAKVKVNVKEKKNPTRAKQEEKVRVKQEVGV